MQLGLSFSLVFIFGIFFMVPVILTVHFLSSHYCLYINWVVSLFWQSTHRHQQVCFWPDVSTFILRSSSKDMRGDLRSNSYVLLASCSEYVHECRNVRPNTNLLVSVSALSEFSPSVMPFNFIVVVHRIAMYWTWWVMARNISSTRMKQFLPLFHSCLDICTQQKNSIKKLLYKSVGIDSAVFKSLDISSGVTGAHGSHFLMEESDPWITLHSGNASVFHALDHWPAQTVIYSPIQAAWVLLQDACIFPQPVLWE